MNEVEWTRGVSQLLNKEFKNYSIEAGKKLTYANEITKYDNANPLYHDMKYETDILIYEKYSEKNWIPRVVIESKINSISTHDAITYSKKAQDHKNVHPYLRYGILIGNHNFPLPGRLFRHGSHFDFMINWKSFTPSEEEFKNLLEILSKEIVASIKLEEMIFENRKRDRTKIHFLHKPLITKE